MQEPSSCIPNSSCNIIPALQAPQQPFHYFTGPLPQQPITCGVFDRPGIPLFMSQQVPSTDPQIGGSESCAESIAYHSLVSLQKKLNNSAAPYNIMSFTSSQLPLVPRRLGKNDIEVEDRPFPFHHSKDPTSENLDPIFDETSLLQTGTSSSDNVRVAVSVSDLLRSGVSDNVQAVTSTDSILDAASVLKELKNTNPAAVTTNP